MDKHDHPIISNIRRNIFSGVLVVIPIWITFLALKFILGFCVKTMKPFVTWLQAYLLLNYPEIHDLIDRTWLENTISVLIILIAFYLLGLLTTKWLGKRLIKLFDDFIDQIPVAKTIYNSVKRLTDVLQKSPSSSNRVALIEFPSADMKTVGIVTHTFKDDNTGREVAAVYVPTTPNPTSGYLEIVPVEKLTPTPWKLDEAMSFIMSGGADLPKQKIFDKVPAKDTTK